MQSWDPMPERDDAIAPVPDALGPRPDPLTTTPAGAPVIDEVQDDDESLVRPFVITGGRTRHATVHLRVEALVVATDTQPSTTLQFEHASIVEICQHLISVAEVAARIGVPLGVAQILVGDLADVGL